MKKHSDDSKHFKFVRETGKATPAEWKPSEEGIEPTIEKAGKI